MKHDHRATSARAQSSSASVIPLPIRQPLVCTECGASGEGSCRCGAPYVAPGQRAAEAVTANPNKSDRAIAADIGVDHKTVSKARKSGGEYSPPEKRTGKDGKSYPVKRKRRKRKAKPAPHLGDPIQDPCLDCNSEEERWQRSCMTLASECNAFWSHEFGKWESFEITTELITLAEDAGASWQQLARDLKRRKQSSGARRD